MASLLSTKPSVVPATALFMAISTFCTAVPPASAWTPTDDMAVPMASTSACVKPAILPAPAMRSAKAAMSRSVVAKLLPRSTMVLPRRWLFSPMSSVSMPKMLAMRAKLKAASSVVRLVATPRSATVLVKSTSASLPTPSCPAISPMPASSSTATGTSLARSRKPWRTS